MMAPDAATIRAAILGALAAVVWNERDKWEKLDRFIGRRCFRGNPKALRASKVLPFSMQMVVFDGEYVNAGRIRLQLKKLEAEGLIVDTSRFGAELSCGWSKYRLATPERCKVQVC